MWILVSPAAKPLGGHADGKTVIAEAVERTDEDLPLVVLDFQSLHVLDGNVLRRGGDLLGYKNVISRSSACWHRAHIIPASYR